MYSYDLNFLTSLRAQEQLPGDTGQPGMQLQLLGDIEEPEIGFQLKLDLSPIDVFLGGGATGTKRSIPLVLCSAQENSDQNEGCGPQCPAIHITGGPGMSTYSPTDLDSSELV